MAKVEDNRDKFEGGNGPKTSTEVYDKRREIWDEAIRDSLIGLVVRDASLVMADAAVQVEMLEDVMEKIDTDQSLELVQCHKCDRVFVRLKETRAVDCECYDATWTNRWWSCWWPKVLYS